MGYYKDPNKVDIYDCEVKVNGSIYILTPLDKSDTPVQGFVRGYRLEKKDAKRPGVYDVIQKEDGFECDCHDWKFRREGQDSSGCKHLRAMFHFGFMEKVIPLPPVESVSPHFFPG